jgi:hypothetical protein
MQPQDAVPRLRYCSRIDVTWSPHAASRLLRAPASVPLPQWGSRASGRGVGSVSDVAIASKTSKARRLPAEAIAIAGQHLALPPRIFALINSQALLPRRANHDLLTEALGGQVLDPRPAIWASGLTARLLTAVLKDREAPSHCGLAGTRHYQRCIWRTYPRLNQTR